MRISNKAMPLILSVCLAASQFLTPVGAHAETEALVADQEGLNASVESSRSDISYSSEFSGSSFRYEDGFLREDIEPISTFSIPQWPVNATGWGIDVSYAQGQID